MLTIGQLARESGVGVETIRFYERKGLVAQPSRPGSGFRRYPPDAVARVRFIQQSKAIGFSLREIKGLLSLRADASTSCAAVKKTAREKMAEIETKISALSEMKRALARMTKACSGRGPVAECPILDALEHGRSSVEQRRKTR